MDTHEPKKNAYREGLEDHSSSLRLEIAVPINRGTRTIFLTNSSSHFHVVLQNVTHRPLRIWSESCSWGYEALSLEIRQANGYSTLLTRKTIFWKQNFPDFLTLLPNEVQVFDIYFARGDWPHFPLPPQGRSHLITLRAVYNVLPDAFANRHGVWTGRILSPGLTLQIVNHSS